MSMTPKVRRYPNGSIDFDFYRAEAAALRKQARREAIMRAASAHTQLMAGAIGFAIVVPSST